MTTPGAGPETDLPSSAMRPDDSGSRPAISSSSVLLPQPDGPRIATNSPFSTVRSISRRAVTERPPAPGHTFPTCRHESVVMARVATTRSGVGSALYVVGAFRTDGFGNLRECLAH